MKYRHTMIVFGLSLPVCVLLRVMQLIFTIDNNTGFIKQQYTSISTLITVIVCAAAVSVGLLAVFTNEITKNAKMYRPSVAATCMLLGGMFIFQTVASLSNLSSNAWYNILLIFLSLASAFVFLLYGVKNVSDYQIPPMVLVVPVVYFVVKLISVFVSTSALALVTENIFLIFTNSVLLWFVFEFACFENEIGDTLQKPTRLFASGLSAIVLCASNSVPKLIQIACYKIQITRVDIAEILLNISLALFIFSYITGNFINVRASKKTAPKHLA